MFNQNNRAGNRNVRNNNNQPQAGQQQQPQLNVQQPQHQNQLAPFMSQNPTRIQTNKCFGPEATAALQAKYEYLITHKKFDISRSAPHDHPYGAFVRETFDNAILSGCATGDYIVSVGTENRNQMQDRYFRGSNQPKHESVHGMAPCIGGLDELRHKEWTNALRQKQFNTPVDITYHAIAKNVCDTAANAGGLCRCLMPNSNVRWAAQAVFKSVDSAYYDGVLEGILVEMMNRPTSSLPSYIVFNNYAKAVQQEEFEYKTLDAEAEVEITIDRDNYYRVKSKVVGNPYAYKHRILNVPAGGTWVYRHHNGDFENTFVFHVLDSFDMGKHDYLLVKITNLGESDITPTIRDLFLNAGPVDLIDTPAAKIVVGVAELLVNSVQSVKNLYKRLRKQVKTTKTVNYVDWDAQEKGTLEMVKWLYEHTNTLADGDKMPATLTYDVENNIIVVVTPVLVGERYLPYTYHVLPEHLTYCVNQSLHRPNQSEAIALLRKLETKLMDENGPVGRMNHTTIMETAAFAHLIAVRLATRHSYLTTNDEVHTYKNLVKGFAPEITATSTRTWQNAVIGTQIKEFANHHIWRITFCLFAFLIILKLYRMWQFDPFLYIDGIFDIRRYIGAMAQSPKLYDPMDVFRTMEFHYQEYLDSIWRALTQEYFFDNKIQSLAHVKCFTVKRIIVPLYESFVPSFAEEDLETISQRFWAFSPQSFSYACLVENKVKQTFFSVIDILLLAIWAHSWVRSMLLRRAHMVKKAVILLVVIALDFAVHVAAMEGTGKGAPTKIYQVMGAAMLARGVIKRGYATYYDRNNTKTIPEKVTSRKNRHRQVLKNVLSGRFAIFLVTIMLLITPVSAQQKRVDTNHYWFWTVIIVIGCMMICSCVRSNRKIRTPLAEKGQRKWVAGSCVFDDERLNFAGIPKEAEFKIKTRGLFNLTDTPKIIREKVGCKCGDKPYAGQIGPIIRGSGKNLPTIKHPCELNTLAALKRSLECVVQPDPKYMTTFEKEYEKLLEQVKMYIVEEGGMHVDHVKWLEHHPIRYREKIMKSWEEQRDYETRYNYDIFPKVEMQITEVSLEERETEKNDMKERCIFGPKDIKKLDTGALMWELEKLLDRNHRTYCGNKNWTQICEKLVEVRNEFRAVGIEPVPVEADFSRYDTTQKKRMLTAFANFIKGLVFFAWITFSEILCPHRIVDYVFNSICIVLVAFMGLIKAWVWSRASGDTWTTLANSINSEISWKSVLIPYGFNPTLNGVAKGYLPCFMTFKGDDMFGFIDPRNLELFRTAVSMGFNSGNDPTPKGVGCIVKIVESGPIWLRSFLSAYFFERRDGTLRMMRKPERVFLTNPYSTKINPTMDPAKLEILAQELLFAKGQSMLAWAENLPIFDVLARKMISLGKGCEVIPEWADKARICTDVKETDYEDCCDWMFEKYGLTVYQIKDIERQIMEITDINADVEIPALDCFFKY